MPRKTIYREGFFKVSRRLLESSLWCEKNPDALRVFLTLVALSQDPASPRNGTVFIARRQLAAKCFLSTERLDAAVFVLENDDIESRTQARGGRRVESLPNGFRVLNYSLYHDREADRTLSLARSAAGAVGGKRSGEVRAAQAISSKQTPSKPEASREQNEATRLILDKTETRQERKNGHGERSPFLPTSEDRQKAESEALRLCREIGEINGEDGPAVMAKAANYKGAERTKINPATMTDDRLLNTLSDLRSTLAAFKGAK